MGLLVPSMPLRGADAQGFCFRRPEFFCAEKKSAHGVHLTLYLAKL